MTKLKIYILLVFAILFVASSPLQYSIAEFLAVFKFASYTTWPNNSSNQFVIYTDIDQLQFENLQQIFKEQMFDNEKVVVKPLDSDSNYDDAKLVYVTKSISQEILFKIKDKPILTITNNKDLLGFGIMFYFEENNSTIDYLYNKESIKESGLYIKSTVLNESHQVK